MSIQSVEPTEPQEPQEPGGPESPTAGLLAEMDAEDEQQRANAITEHNREEAAAPPGPVRRSRSAAPVGEETPEGEEPPERVENYDIAIEKGNNYHDWMREKYGKYRSLLSVKATDDFIDHDAVNTVMADYGVICIEIVREARIYKDAAEDAQEKFDEWWGARLSEVRALMPKAATNVAVESKTMEQFGHEKSVRWATAKDAQRRSDFLGSIKEMIRNMKGVLQNLGHALAFEWTTTGGITVEEAGKTFRFSPARRTGGRPPMEAVIAARRKKKEQ